MATISIPNPATVHKPLATAIERRRKLLDEEADLRRRYDKATHDGAMPSNDHGLVSRADANSKELMGASTDIAIEKQTARGLARAALESDKSFQSLVAETAEALAVRVKALVAYEQVRLEAGRAGVSIMPLPASAGRELADARSWVREAKGRGMLDAALSPSVRALLAEGAS